MTKASHEAPPAWVARGQAHLWRPYCQMKNAAPALPVVAIDGTRLTLADGRVLIDGIASWWTACHEASGAAAAMTRNTMRGVDNDARRVEPIGVEDMRGLGESVAAALSRGAQSCPGTPLRDDGSSPAP